MRVQLKTHIEHLLPSIIELRHELHQHPEIRFQEVWTSGRIAQFLDNIGVSYQRGYAGGTGIAATIRGGPGRTIALRADMDALEIQEETGLPYASQIPNRMHACGHDGHSAILCGVARVLQEWRDELHGTVKLLFQPGEETAAGGRLIVEEGLLDDVDAVFALHGWPSIPLGRIAVKSGWLMAGARDFHITVRGKGCHGADPASGVDPIVAASHIVLALQTIVSREVDPWETGVVTVGVFQAGQATNIIPETAILRGTMRSLNPAVLDHIADAVRRVAEQTAQTFRAAATMQLGSIPYPPLYNDPGMTQFLRETVEEVLGPEHLMELEHPNMAAEDFAFYLQKKPGAIFYVGVNPNPTEAYPLLHNPRYDFTDAALAPAIQTMAGLALRFLHSPS